MHVISFVKCFLLPVENMPSNTAIRNSPSVLSKAARLDSLNFSHKALSGHIN
uniref:Uncharacterized protein n=1 Tax=Anguilla anguilla TaxID=7936 RepID=A0A0E9P9Y2_ANGAN